MNKGRKKWKPVHEVVAEILEDMAKPQWTLVLAYLYASRAKVPLEGIERLRKSLQKRRGISPEVKGIVDQAIAALNQQEKEAQRQMEGELKERKSIHEKIAVEIENITSRIKTGIPAGPHTLVDQNAEKRAWWLASLYQEEFWNITPSEILILIQNLEQLKECSFFQQQYKKAIQKAIQNLKEEGKRIASSGQSGYALL